MNNSIFNYLTEQANQFVNRTESIITQIGEYFKTHGKQLKKSAIALALAGLTTTSAMGMTGCQELNPDNEKDKIIFDSPQERYGDDYRGNNPTASTEIQYGSDHEPFEQLEVRTREEMEQSGITAEDVLAIYDQLATEMWKLQNPIEKFFGTISQEEYDNISIRFESISPYLFSYEDDILDPESGEYYVAQKHLEYPFYFRDSFYTPSHRWFDNQLSHITPEELMNSAYKSAFNISFVYDNKIYATKINNVGLYSTSFENVFDSLGIEKSIIDEDDYAFANQNKFFKPDAGSTKYSPITLDRTIIENATEEQLWALYDMASTIRTINLEGKAPMMED